MIRILSTAILLAVTQCFTYADRVRITADNVNLRADSNLNSRVMGQVSRDTILDTQIAVDEWFGVRPPDNIFGWIHSGLVSSGIVSASRANIRSGPGINYQVIAHLSRADKAAVNGEFGEWLKVSLPEGTLVWVSRKFTEPLNTNELVQTIIPENDHTAKTEPTPTGIAAKPPKPADPNAPLELHSSGYTGETGSAADPLAAAGITTNMLVQTEKQAVQAACRGTLKKSSIVWRRPSRYLLVDTDGNKSPLCYVTGSDAQLEALVQRQITVEGRQYIIQGSKLPLLLASRITIH